MLDIVKDTTVNGLDLARLGAIIEGIEQDAGNAPLSFAVTTRWTGGTRTETEVGDVTFGRETLARDFTIVADEPTELSGTNSAPNPQELLMAAFNACISVGYVAGAAMKGINLDKLEIRTRGTLDLRGFFGLSDQVAPGYEQLDYEVSIEGDGSAEDYLAIHEQVMKTSPNYFNLGRPIRLNGRLNAG